jgi:aminocarboxymuconate-semialdehyde decarboxylase
MNKLRPDLPLVVDFHAHMLEEEVSRYSAGRTVLSGFGMHGSAAARTSPGTRMWAQMTDPAVRVADMDAAGIDVAVVSSSSVNQGTSWADPASDLAMSRRCNDRIAEWLQQSPDRLVGCSQLPLQDVELALVELERAVNKLGHRVVNASSNYGGIYLGEEKFARFWSAVRDLDVTVWIHPEGSTDLWLQKYSMWNSLGQPIEETKVIASLIYEGVLERHPDLKIVISHGGGYLPHYFGRLDRNVTNMPESVRNITRKPSEYLRSLYFDTCVYEPGTFEALVKRVGADRVVFGSDYPFGESEPLGFLDRASFLSRGDVAQIAGMNAARLLGLPAASTVAG